MASSERSQPRRSRLYYDAPPESGPAGIRRRCKCGRPYLQYYKEQRSCQRCRQLHLILDSRRGKEDAEAQAELLYQRLLEAAEHANDYQLYDEHGRLVWASELAKRYRTETQPRPARGGIRKYL